MRVNLIVNILLTITIIATIYYTLFMYKQDKQINKFNVALTIGSIITITLAIILWQTARL